MNFKKVLSSTVILCCFTLYFQIRPLISRANGIIVNSKHVLTSDDSPISFMNPDPVASATVSVSTSPSDGMSSAVEHPVAISSEPTQILQHTEGKKIEFKCDKKLIIRPGNIEILPLKIGEKVNCTLYAARVAATRPGGRAEVFTSLTTGSKVSIKAEPMKGMTDENREFYITITAVDTGIDWVGWALADENGNFEFSNEAYEKGDACGMFVEVRL